MSFYLILLIHIFTAAVAQIFFKKGISALGTLEFSLSNIFALIPRILQNVWLLSGMFLFGISFLVYLFVLSRFQLNIVYPTVVSSGIIIISLASWFFFKETLSWLQISGIILIIFGIFLLAVKG